MAKSPKLFSETDFRLDNWNEEIGMFFCDLTAIQKNNINAKPNKKNKNKTYSSYDWINLFQTFINTNKDNYKDDYIYSIYNIRIKDNNTFFCDHLADLTQKK